ncbi:RNA polymerase II mediator complex subunit [Orbilia brochopaga]|uniref:Mediator of RNA polymerase II transcription subunit 12 n=1 Tax=Orbilia brochopaga TaxID=3140254 RepID=A0AAV9V0Q9_9PEZI
MSTVAKPRQQRGGRRPSQPLSGATPGPLVIPGSGSHASTPTSSQSNGRVSHSRQSSKSASVIDLTSPTLPTPTSRGRGRSGSVVKSSAASPSILRSAAQESFPPTMPPKGPLDVSNSRRKARYAFPFPTTAQQQQNGMVPFLVSFSSQSVDLRVIPQPNRRPKRSTRQKVVVPPPTTTQLQAKDKLKSYNIEPPTAMHSYPFRDSSGKDLKDTKFPDFFPWKGNHAEDHVTEHAARTGFSDKMHPGEQGSAKNLLAPLIKKTVGVDVISSMFVTVLEKRLHFNKITAASTFKFPPRVTFPGQKKEMWLRDLANSTIPLRKLSRMIPLGLRGKELLEECTAKNIPLLRALWYVRCVGANELRTLKRKGAGLAVGNEAKWLREWTQGIIHYFERAMADCTKEPPPEKPAWKTRMSYVLRLTSYLYSENLLDKTLFLEWYMSLLETCSLDRLPLAMLILRAEWTHLTSSHKFCRRLVDALLSKVTQITTSGEADLYEPLLHRLSAHVTRLLLHNRQAFVNPKSWPANEKPLLACVDTTNPAVRACIENIAARNRNLDSDKPVKGGVGIVSPRKAAIDFLDNIRAPYDIEEVTDGFLSLSSDYQQTVKALCEWAVTSLRVGLQRLYFAVRLLRRISRLGVQIQPPLHEFLLATTGGRRCKKHVYLLVSELVRSKHFAAGKYMSWLISRGALMRHESVDEEQPCYIRLLAEIPVSQHHATNPQRNLRSNLLLQKGFIVSQESASLARAKEIVTTRIPGIFTTDLKTDSKPESAFTFEELGFLCTLTRNAMSELGFWVCDAIRKRQALLPAHHIHTSSMGWRASVSEAPTSVIAVGEFLLVRKLLEELEDFGVLTEVIKLVAATDNPEMLSAAADTMSSNVEVYFAIGVVTDILKSLFDRYKALQVRRTMEHRHVERYLTTALFNFAQFFGCDAGIRRSLESDLELSRTQAMMHFGVEAMAVGGLSQAVTAVLAGTMLPTPGLVREAFSPLLRGVEAAHHGSDAAQTRRYARLLARLRQVDGAGFDPLMEAWLTQTVKSSSRPTLAVAFSDLLVAGCFELKTVIDIACEVIGGARDDSGSIEAADVTELAFQTLALLLDDEDSKLGLTEQELYSLRLERKRFRATNGRLFVSIFRRAMKLCVTAADPNLERRLEDTMNNEIVLDLLRHLAFSDFDMLVAELVEPLAPRTNPLISKHLSLLIDHLLDEHDSNDVSEVDTDVQVARLLQHVNDFSVRLCRLKMRLIFEAEIAHAADTIEAARLRMAVTKAFVGAITEMGSERSAIWAELVGVLDEPCVAQIRAFTEEMVLNSSAFPDASSAFLAIDNFVGDEEGARRAGEVLARSLINAIDVTAGASPAPATAGMGLWMPPILTDRMNTVLQGLSGVGGDVTIQSDGEITHSVPPGRDGARRAYARLRSWVTLFLRIVALHRTEFRVPKTSLVEQGRMVVGLCALLENKHVQKDEFMFEMALDIACALVDEMSEESRQQLRRFLRRKYHVPQICYLLGGVEAWTMNGVTTAVSGTSEWMRGLSRGRLVDFPVKPWEQVSDPTPMAGDNDTSLSMGLFHARKVGCVNS